MKLLRIVASEIGRGLLSGLVGTAAMTVSSTLEMKLRRRAASATPAKAVERVLGIAPNDQAAEARLANVVHWSYGTMWGIARAVVGSAGVRGCVAAPVLHFAAVWGASLLALPALQVAPPVWQWSREEIAIDVLHHAVYVAAADAAYRATR
jgi:uncharacterized membrane protein YagU involved in acid resistance